MADFFAHLSRSGGAGTTRGAGADRDVVFYVRGGEETGTIVIPFVCFAFVFRSTDGITPVHETISFQQVISMRVYGMMTPQVYRLSFDFPFI